MRLARSSGFCTIPIVFLRPSRNPKTCGAQVETSLGNGSGSETVVVRYLLPNHVVTAPGALLVSLEHRRLAGLACSMRRDISLCVPVWQGLNTDCQFHADRALLRFGLLRFRLLAAARMTRLLHMSLRLSRSRRLSQLSQNRRLSLHEAVSHWLNQGNSSWPYDADLDAVHEECSVLLQVGVRTSRLYAARADLVAPSTSHVGRGRRSIQTISRL